MDVQRFKRQQSSGLPRRRALGMLPNEHVVLARVQWQRMMPVWMAKARWLVLRGSKTPILAVYRQVSTFVMEENPIRVMLLGPDTIVRATGEKYMILTSSRIRRNDTWTLAFASSGQRKRMYELVCMWIELSMLLQNLTRLESISKSHSSVVYRCCDRTDSSRVYAMKRVNRLRCGNEIEVTERIVSVESLQPYIARYVFMFEDSKDNTATIVMKYYNGGSLADRIREIGPLSETIVRNVTASLCIALYLLHQHDVLHLDVKAGNILFDTESPRSFQNLKLVDFGSSAFLSDGQQTGKLSGTYGCMAPERFDGRHGPEADVYGAGVVLFHMVVGEIPFDGNDSYQIMAKNMQGDVSFSSSRWQRVSPQLRQLAMCMLEKDPDRRITLPEILRLPWLFQPHSKHELLEMPCIPSCDDVMLHSAPLLGFFA
ncbi:hypothetical protein PINS_up002486 [Pythium insidiosum]|nr:hypothetical protein PINS_up002486 [Pythium insidiosum]